MKLWLTLLAIAGSVAALAITVAAGTYSATNLQQVREQHIAAEQEKKEQMAYEQERGDTCRKLGGSWNQENLNCTVPRGTPAPNPFKRP